MPSKILTTLATISLLVAFFLFGEVNQPGATLLWAVAMGVAGVLAVRLTVAAAVAAAVAATSEAREKAQR
jgi:hypothetical protein